MNIDWNDPRGLEKLQIKLRISRCLKRALREYTLATWNAIGAPDRKLFDECVAELANEGCLEKQKGERGKAEVLLYKAGR